MIAAALIPEFDHLSRHVEGNPAWEKATMFGELRTATALYGASMALGPERDAIVKAPGRIYSAGKWVGGLFASACAACRGYQSIGGGVSVTYEETDAKVDAEVGAGYGATHSALGMTLGSGE